MGVLFDSTFKLSSAALYLNLSHPSLPLNFKWVVQMFFCYLCYVPVFTSFVYSCFYDNFHKSCTNLSLGLVFLIISCNCGLLTVYKKEFNNMISVVEEDLKCSENFQPEHQEVVKEYTAKGIWASKLWFVLCIFGGGMFPFKAFVGTLYYAITTRSNGSDMIYVPIHQVTYPAYIEERKNDLPTYLIIMCFQSFYVLFTIFMYIGFNPLGPIFILHACGQIELVIKKVDRVFKEEDVDVEETIEQLKDIARHVQHIYSFVDKIQQTHKAIYEMCLKTTTLNLPICCFGIIESYNQGSLSIDLVCFTMACCMQCYIPCYYCEVLMSKDEDLQVAIYGSGWEKHWVTKSRPVILLMMIRAARPLGIRAVFCTVCMEAFAKVCNQSYSIFHVINAAWD